MTMENPKSCSFRITLPRRTLPERLGDVGQPCFIPFYHFLHPFSGNGEMLHLKKENGPHFACQVIIPCACAYDVPKPRGKERQTCNLFIHRPIPCGMSIGGTERTRRFSVRGRTATLRAIRLASLPLRQANPTDNPVHQPEIRPRHPAIHRVMLPARRPVFRQRRPVRSRIFRSVNLPAPRTAKPLSRIPAPRSERPDFRVMLPAGCLSRRPSRLGRSAGTVPCIRRTGRCIRDHPLRSVNRPVKRNVLKIWMANVSN